MDVIPYAGQPRPTKALFHRLDGVTAISRTWAAGDCARCRLCPTCTAVDNHCLVQTTEYVPDTRDAVELYDRTGIADASRAGGLAPAGLRPRVRH